MENSLKATNLLNKSQHFPQENNMHTCRCRLLSQFDDLILWTSRMKTNDVRSMKSRTCRHAMTSQGMTPRLTSTLTVEN